MDDNSLFAIVGVLVLILGYDLCYLVVSFVVSLWGEYNMLSLVISLIGEYGVVGFFNIVLSLIIFLLFIILGLIYCLIKLEDKINELKVGV